MKNHVNKLVLLFSVLSLILVLSSGTAYGQTNGAEKTASLIDSLPKPVLPPKRITYQQEKGVFLNELQEQITLEKLLWKEQYRQDAVSMYWVNKALEERINEVIARNMRLEQDLQKAETQAVYATANMEHYRTLFKDVDATNVNLTKENSQLKLGNFIWKTGTITFSITTLYFGVVKPLILR